MEAHDIIQRMFDDIAESERIDEGIPDKEKYERYQKALEIAMKWAREDRISKLTYDAPDESLIGNQIIITLKNEDFKDEEECKELLDYLSSFDQIGIYGTTAEDVDIACLSFIYSKEEG